MDERKPSATAAGVALLRVLHQKVDAEPRILRDDVAERLLDPRAVRWAMDHRDQFETPRSRGLRVHVVVRSRYSEDSLAAAAARGVRQLVLLGAGFDTFAFRQPEWAKALRIFEADHPATQEEKRRRVARTELAVPGQPRLRPRGLREGDPGRRATSRRPRRRPSDLLLLPGRSHVPDGGGRRRALRLPGRLSGRLVSPEEIASRYMRDWRDALRPPRRTTLAHAGR